MSEPHQDQEDVIASGIMSRLLDGKKRSKDDNSDEEVYFDKKSGKLVVNIRASNKEAGVKRPIQELDSSKINKMLEGQNVFLIDP